jgi:tRNA threonylcarbamoyladenosine modification (KEOPS) complex Cgi121 subunit
MMLHTFEDFKVYAEITGLRGISFERADAYLKANRKVEGQKVWIQFFNADLIATKEHLYFAVLNALTAFKSGTNLSKSLAMETMLYASSQRQIQKAIQVIGVKPETTELAVVIIGETPESVKAALKEVSAFLHSKPDDSVLDLTSKKTAKIKEAFEISPAMIESIAKDKNEDLALVNLVIERVALLATAL